MRHGFVRIAKRQAFFHQIVGQIGGGGVALAGGFLHAVFVHRQAAFFNASAWVGLPANHFSKDAQRVFQSVYRVEQRLFVFLVVFVVGQRLGFHQSDQPHQVADHAPGFAAREFGHVRVFFLRHDARAGGEAVGDLYEAEVLTHPNDELFAQAADVQHAQRGGRGELDGEVAVADRIQTVLTDFCCAVRVHHAECAGDEFAV